MFLIIVDAKTALSGVAKGLELCIRNIIPALFPLCVLSKYLIGSIAGQPIPFLRPLGKVCGLSYGAETILLSGFVGGYPIGAQCLNDAYRKKTITIHEAHRMTAFCNNAGPAFIFGILGQAFDNPAAVWALMGLQVVSAILVAVLIPGRSNAKCKFNTTESMPLTTAVEQSIRAMAAVCSWVILFRTAMAYFERWVFPRATPVIKAILTGILELSNGCISLQTIVSPGLKYIIAAGMLSFGGLCVAMQTRSVTKQIGGTLYLPGKILQASITVFLAYLSQPILFRNRQYYPVPVFVPVGCLLFAGSIIFVLRIKKGRNPEQNDV